MKNKKTVSVYIPAYNEEKNISRLLKSLVKQKGKNFDLEAIAVVDDGSVDKTQEIVMAFSKKFPKISCLVDGRRLGKIDRLNQIYKLNKSNILVVFDGDIILKSSGVIEEIIRKFEDESVVLVGANKKPLASNIFTEKLINTWYYIFYEMRKDINKGDNIHNFISCAYALKDSFAKSLHYPRNVYPITKFTYFSALNKGLKFKFAQRANIYYRSPNNIKDFALQVNRFSGVEKMNEKYWGNWINQVCHISLKRKILVTTKMIVTHPIMCTLAILLRLVANFYRVNQKSGKIWAIAESTKG